jgi:hypothetical protein
MRRLVIMMLALIAGLSLTTGAAWAGPRLTDFFSTCTTLGCSSINFTGTYGHDQFSNADPFVVQVFTAGNECVRVELLSQGTDLEATLTCPSGRTWQNDDKGGASCPLCPLIKAVTPSPRGWCTLTISSFTGEGSPTDFTARYGRYPSTNINCAAPTPPSIFSTEATAGKVQGNGANGPQLEGGSTD